MFYSINNDRFPDTMYKCVTAVFSSYSSPPLLLDFPTGGIRGNTLTRSMKFLHVLAIQAHKMGGEEGRGGMEWEGEDGRGEESG